MLIINKKKNVKTFWVGALFTGLLDPSKQIKFIDGLRSEIQFMVHAITYIKSYQFLSRKVE